jgi:general secretion pathway protein A
MYESFFHLQRKPFELLPNPDFLYLSKSHKRAMSYLDYGIRERAGFILLTGEVGSGKTTIIRNLIKKHHDNVIISKIFNTRVNSEQLIAMINDDFGLSVSNKDKITILRELNEFLIEQYVKGNHPVLVIDEAQNLSLELLEEIRMLSNLETDNAKLLQIILVGQPELRSTLASGSLIQLRQRISINCHIQPLNRQETEQYILHRLDKAGDRDAVSFSENTHDIIFRYSRGIPRLINIICDFLLLSAFAEETTKIDEGMVKDIIGDLDFDHHFWDCGSSEKYTSPEIHADTAPATNPAIDEFSSMVRSLNERLDSMGKQSEVFNQSMFQEITTKISTLEQALKSHREETGSMMTEIRKSQTTGSGDKGIESFGDEEKNVRGGFFKRMLGV